MKSTLKTLGVFILILSSIAVYWNFEICKKTQYLHAYATPFYQACISKIGCIIDPEGWSKNTKTSYFKNNMEYSATKHNFELSWHIATDIYLVATGGIDQEIKIVRKVD